MNKNEVISSIANDTGLSKADAARALDATLSAIRRGVSSDPVQLVGFGTFRNSRRKARTGRNPRTGAAIKIPARTVMTFKASKNPKY